MSRQTTPAVPATTTYLCDRCGGDMRHDGVKLKGHQYATGLDGAMGGWDSTLDLCGRCDRALRDWLRAGVPGRAA